MALPSTIRTRAGNAYDLGALTLDVAIFAVATVGTYFAQVWDRPRTAVLVYVVGVMIIGGRAGLARGLVAGVAASFVYNFFLSEPLFHFGVTSSDELIPLIAFNIAAVLSGAMAGRLKDSVSLARVAEARNAHLLGLSDELQRAIAIGDVLRISRASLPFERVRDLDIFVLRDGLLFPADGSGPAVSAAQLLAEETRGGTSSAYALNGSAGQIGFVRFQLDSAAGALDLQGIANILGLAVDRCLLLDRLSETEAQRKSEDLKAAILSSVSHDLRTPLTAIEAAATSLRSFDQRLSPKDRADMLATISEQCGKLNRYTANLLDMGRIQAGIPAYLFVEVDVVEILGVVLASLREAYPGQEIAKQITVDAAVVRANPAMLEQVIFNLAENAILHGASDRPVFLVLTRVGEAVVLEVVDFGPGILRGEQTLVFDKFYRSRSSQHREGTGLGLHIANGFVEAFGGTIAIVSPHFGQRGARLVVELPLVPASLTTPHDCIGHYE
ncbi:MAG: ATP-binding protein [Candidatus Andeanibacterium colombiense]|uniref:histidine kinase n=1 Tax=Candidatus Andeanibacterium colombiense TaxID=3121345 RepID=A0AAJ5X3Q4_9SPHN|nr:MAG: ATP-binding protein [Sphingomonadaceae bacterium]